MSSNARKPSDVAITQAGAKSIFDFAVTGIQAGQEPFKYIVIDHFFREDIYQILCEEMGERLRILRTGELSPRSFFAASQKSGTTGESYDAYIGRFLPEGTIASDVFYSREFYDFWQIQFPIPFGPEVLGTFHHHEIGSKTGWVHSDYNFVKFPRIFRAGGLCPLTPIPPEIADPPQVSRCVAILYYLNNPDWRENDGGETGLFDRTDATEPILKVAPINNRILAFEISPDSHHTFLQNVRTERNAIAFWFHTHPMIMTQKWGVGPSGIV